MQPSDTVLMFYAFCDDPLGLAPYPIYRPGTAEPTLGESLEALVAGTTAGEREFGLSTGFDFVEEADEITMTAEVDADGIAHIDFLVAGERWDPGGRAGTTHQLLSFMEPLMATAFRHHQVSGLDLTTMCWGESDCEGVISRSVWEGMLFVNAGVLTHGGCTPEFAWLQPDRCAVEDVPDRSTTMARVVNVSAGDVLNVRSGPGVEFFAVGELEPGVEIEVSDEAAVATDGGIWRLVTSPQSGTGWVNQAFLDLPRTSEEALVDAFVDFAEHPSDDTFQKLPLGSEVDLGLGSTIITSVPSSKLRQPAAWLLDVEVFRAAAGPFSALQQLEKLDIYDVLTGEHQHCASPPMPPPSSHENLTRISVQPRLGLESSCLMWHTVDFFTTPNGTVEAITLDQWEP